MTGLIIISNLYFQREGNCQKLRIFVPMKFSILTPEYQDFYQLYMRGDDPWYIMKGSLSKDQLIPNRDEFKIMTLCDRDLEIQKIHKEGKLESHLERLSTTNPTELLIALSVCLMNLNFDVGEAKSILAKYKPELREIKELNKPKK